MKPAIGLNEKSRAGVAAILNTVLADEYVLYTKTRNFHWNVVGPQFSELHKFFESQYEAIDGTIDEVAERVRALGEAAAGSLGEFAKLSRLKETPALAKRTPAEKMIEILLNDHEALISTLREDLETAASKYKDAGTQDFLTGIMEEHEKMAWMLRSYLEN